MLLELELSQQVRFEPAGKVTQIFFDDLNEQVFSVRSGGATGLISKGFLSLHCSTFRLTDAHSAGPQIITLKLSPDQKLLSIQRNQDEVSFTPVVQLGAQGKLEDKSFSQACKTKGSLLGFSWINGTDIVYFTQNSIELFSVLQERKMVKSIRSQAQLIAWYIFEPKIGVLVTSPTPSTRCLQPYAVKGGYIYRLPKIDLESNADTAELREKDVSIVRMCEDKTYIAILQHKREEVVAGASSSSSSSSSSNSYIEVHMYKVSKDFSSVSGRHLLRVPSRGPVSLNVVDNLILVHNRSTKTSFVFDIQMSGAEFDGSMYRHRPLCSGHIVFPDSEGASARDPGTEVDLYSQHWVAFQPDLLVDAKSGLMWKLRIKLCSELSEVSEMARMVKFLQQRDGGKAVLLEVFLQRCMSLSTDVHVIGQAFDLINHEYRVYLDNQIQQNMALPASSFPSPSVPFRPFTAPATPAAVKMPAKVILDQADLYTNIFAPLSNNPDIALSRIIALVVEYFRSLNQVNIPAQHFLNEFIINLLVQNEAWYQLHQLLQYHVILDSKPLACLLLSLESVYPPACQLALDMLHRMRNSSEEICEILLSKGRIITALKYAYKSGVERLPARKFLEAATREDSDPMTFFNAYKWFEEHHMLGRDCDQYKQIFRAKFGSE